MTKKAKSLMVKMINKSLDFEYSEYLDGFDNKSVGAVSKFESFDQNVLQSYLRKERKLEDIDPLGDKILEQEISFPINDGTSSIDIPSVYQPKQPKHRESIMHNKGIPRKMNKVQFSLPIQEDKKRQDTLSPDNQRVSRRSTITHNKLDVDVLRKYSIIAAGTFRHLIKK